MKCTNRNHRKQSDIYLGRFGFLRLEICYVALTIDNQLAAVVALFDEIHSVGQG